MDPSRKRTFKNELYEQFARIGKVLDDVLSKSRYVAGENLTVADFAIGSPMCIAEQAKFPIEPFRSIQRWKADLKSLPSWTKTEALRVPPKEFIEPGSPPKAHS